MDFTGERYIPGEGSYELHTEHIARYQFAQQLVANKIVLDAACGEGYGSNLLAETALEVHALDIAEEAINHAKEKYSKENLHFICGSIEKMPLEDNSIDVVVSFETIEHVSGQIQKQFLYEIKRVLKPDGLLVISTPNKSIYTDLFNYHNEFHQKEFYAKEFKVFLKGHFKNIDFYNQSSEAVNVVAKTNMEQLNIVENDMQQSAKYLIAICSEAPLPEKLIGVFSFSEDENLLFLKKRIIKLQEEESTRNQHIKYLDNEILNGAQEIERLNSHLEKLSAWGQALDEELHLLREKYGSANNEVKESGIRLANVVNWGKDLEREINKLKLENTSLHQEMLSNEAKVVAFAERLYEKEKEMGLLSSENALLIEKSIQNENAFNDLEVSLNNKLGHIELLLESERNLQRQVSEREQKLEDIYQSTGWKLLIKCYSFRDTLFPPKSKRRFVIKLGKKFIKRPGVYFRKLNKENIKKLRYYASVEGIDNLGNRLDAFDERYLSQDQNQSLQIQNMDAEVQFDQLIFPIVDKPKVSIIIPVFNQFRYTYLCLKSILDNTNDVDYEVIIADDVSNDDTISIKEIVKNITVVRNQSNLGFLLNCNNASQYARGRYIHFLNNDTQVQQGWLSSLVTLLESNEKIGMVGSKLVYPNGKLQEAGGILWREGSAWNFGNQNDPSLPEYNYVKEVDYISGASIMIRQDLWMQIGGFDERYVSAYYEDTDLAFEVRKRGYKVVYQPLSVVLHFEGISNGTDTSSGLKAYQIQNGDTFHQKWNEILNNEHYKNAENVFLARDRSRSKKHILVVDHYVPHHDKDAGGKCTFMYIKMFLKLGLQVTFIGDNFCPHEPYTTELQQLGVEVLYGNYYNDNWKKWLKENGKYFDYAYLNRPHISEKYIDLIRSNSSAKVIYFGHDLHHLRERRQFEIDHNPAVLKSSEEWKTREYALFNKADVIYVVGSYEQKLLQKEFPKKEIRDIPVYIYDGIKTTQNHEFQQREGIIFVGGFGHPPNADAVLWFAANVFPTILKEIPSIIWYIVGSKPPQDVQNLAGEHIKVTGFISDPELENLYQTCRMAVVPLRIGAGVKGKVVEAVYNGLPLITTSIGAEGLSLTEDAFVVVDEAEAMAEQVVKLYSDYDRLKELSAHCKDFIQAYFTVEVAEQILRNDIEV